MDSPAAPLPNNNDIKVRGVPHLNIFYAGNGTGYPVG
jgi:hypothetical protein